MRTYKTEGIILKRTNFGEADRIITIFTKHYGKVKAIAKGVRKVKSRRAPHLELFNRASLFLSTGKNLDIITEAQVINSFSNLKRELKKIGLAFKACELVDQLTREDQVQKEVFNLLVSCFNQLNHQSKTKSLMEIVRNFEMKLLQILGFLPKGKALEKIDVERFIEEIIERKLKSKKFFSEL